MLRALFLVCFVIHFEGVLSIANLTGVPTFENVFSKADEDWRKWAIAKFTEERRKMNHTPLVKVPLKGFPNVDFYLKNETASASGTLKHRFAWALVLWAVLNGKISKGTRVVDSTSGNTGASEAYMCSLIGVNFTAVISDNLEEEKRRHIKLMNGTLIESSAPNRSRKAEQIGSNPGHFFLNQFGNADRAEESRDSGDYSLETVNVFHEILDQLKKDFKVTALPDFFVHSAGTGGTISSVGRYIQRYGMPTRVILADSQYSAFYDYVKHARFEKPEDNATALWKAPGVEGIGYGYNLDPVIYGKTTSLVPAVIHEVAKIPDAATFGALRVLNSLATTLKVVVNAGASTALNFITSLYYANKNKGTAKKHTSIVSILSDPGSYYVKTYLNKTWLPTVDAVKLAGGPSVVDCWEKVVKQVVDKGGDVIALGKTCAAKPK